MPNSTETRIPVIAIVGRQNVGKSSLVNALAGTRRSIVDPMPGVTRDRVSHWISLEGRQYELMDTGGVGLDRAAELRRDIDAQIELAIRHADLVLFVVDAKSGVMALDQEMARRLRVAEKDVVLVANKVDHSGRDESVNEFSELGFGEAVAVSAAHRRGLEDLSARIVSRLPGSTSLPETGLRIALAGKRNVGKSSYVNALCGEERVIVSEIPGTTRDAVDVRLEHDGHRYLLIDTAGLRKKTKIADSVELFSRDRTEKAIERADVVFFMCDVTDPVSTVDKRLGSKIEELKVPCVLVLNKYDLVPEGFEPEEFVSYLTKAMQGLTYAPLAMVSVLKRERIWQPLDLARELFERAATKIPTPEVNRVLKRAQEIRGPGSRNNLSPKIFYATQTGIRPPTFTLFVNQPANFTKNYLRFLENRFRSELPFQNLPIRLALKARRERGDRSRFRK